MREINNEDKDETIRAQQARIECLYRCVKELEPSFHSRKASFFDTLGDTAAKIRRLEAENAELKAFIESLRFQPDTELLRQFIQLKSEEFEK